MCGENKERTKNMNTLIDEIHKFEQGHKRHKGQHQEIFHRLVIKRDELKDIMEQETKRTFNRIAKERYQWGNKASKTPSENVKKEKIYKLYRKNSKKGREIGLYDKRYSKSV